MARVQQAKILADLSDKAALQMLGERSAAGVVCLADSFTPDYQKSSELRSQLEAMMANTKERAKQYIAYNRAQSGSSGRLPDGDTCEP
jgi:predicted component of type VI protein secretion system